MSYVHDPAREKTCAYTTWPPDRHIGEPLSWAFLGLLVVAASVCGCRQQPEERIEAVIKEAQPSFAGIDGHSWAELQAYSPEEVVNAAEGLLRHSDDSSVRARAMATLQHYRMLSGGWPFTHRILSLAREFLFDEDPTVAAYATQILASFNQTEDVELMADRLEAASDFVLVKSIFVTMSGQGGWDVIHSELHRPFPERAGPAAVQNWKLRTIAAMQEYQTAAAEGVAVPPDVVARVVELVESHPGLAGAGVRCLVSLEARSALPDLERIARDSHSYETAMAAMGALIILRNEDSDPRADVVGLVPEAVAKSQGNPKVWRNIALPTIRWLSWAAFGTGNEKWLHDIWSSCDSLNKGRKAEVMCEMVRNATHRSYVLLEFLHTVPDAELLEMLVRSGELRFEMAVQVPLYKGERQTPRERLPALQAAERRLYKLIQEAEARTTGP